MRLSAPGRMKGALGWGRLLGALGSELGSGSAEVPLVDRGSVLVGHVGAELEVDPAALGVGGSDPEAGRSGPRRGSFPDHLRGAQLGPELLGQLAGLLGGEHRLGATHRFPSPSGSR